MRLEPVERRSGAGYLSGDFIHGYAKTRIPVVLSDFGAHWPARGKWTHDYLLEVVGPVPVVVYHGERCDARTEAMEFGEFLDRVCRGEPSLRLFASELLAHPAARRLLDDLDFPELLAEFVPARYWPTGGLTQPKCRDFPLQRCGTSVVTMFWGGDGSRVQAHRDFDLANVFLVQMQGTKLVRVFSPDQTKWLYANRDDAWLTTDVDLHEPDYGRYPNLRRVEGYECTLQPGETLMIPSGFWHHVKYGSPGYSLCFRVYHSRRAAFRGFCRAVRTLLWLRIPQNLRRALVGQNGAATTANGRKLVRGAVIRPVRVQSKSNSPTDKLSKN